MGEEIIKRGYVTGPVATESYRAFSDQVEDH